MKIKNFYIIHTKNYINDLLLSYKSNHDITRQFELDFQRNTIYINNNLMNDKNYFLKIISKNNDDYVKKIMLLCCQSSYCLMFEYLLNILNLNSNYALVDGKYKYTIIKNINNITIFSVFNIIDVKCNKIITKINAKINFNLNNDIGTLYYAN